MNKNIIEISKIKKIYKIKSGDFDEDNKEIVTYFHALKGIDLSIKSGEMVGIIGPSGSGKSTLMNILGLLDTFDSGEYILDGKNVKNMSPNEIATYRCNKIGFVFQSFNLLDRYSVLDNVYLPTIYNRHKENIDYKEYAMYLLDSVGIKDKYNKFPNQLSGGQKQRVAIARALINKPKIILADEPTGNLDSESGKKILEILKKLNKEGNTIIIITHDNKVAEQCSVTYKIKDGLLS